jgi:hypothetical protein
MEQLITVVVQRQLTLRCRLPWHGFIHSTDNSRLFCQTDIMHSKRLIAALCAVSITALLGMTTPALADNLYCKIVTINNVAATGEPKRLTGKENIRKAAESTEFTIDRSSGLMLGKRQHLLGHDSRRARRSADVVQGVLAQQAGLCFCPVYRG